MPGGRWALLAALVLLAPAADVTDPRVGAGGGRHASAGVAPSEFGQHRWLMTVSSVHNFPVTCCLYGQQLINYIEAAWLAGRVLGRGLIEPSFIHQARDDAVYERLKAQDKLHSINFTAILGTIPVAGRRLFDLWALAEDDEDNRAVNMQAFATNTTFWAVTEGTIDLLIVCDAFVIGGQACADFDRCSERNCQTLPSDPGPFPRRMEFFGRMHFVKRVVCLPYAERQLRGHIDEAAQEPGDTVVALALHNRQINAIAGGSMVNLIFPIASFGNKAYTGQEFWSVDKRLAEDWLSILGRLAPSPQVLHVMHALFQTSLNGVHEYVGVHWRRGDRGHPEMGEQGDRMWALSQPEHLSCEINRLLLEYNVSAVFVGTNCGTPADRERLRALVHAPLVFLSDLGLFQDWQHGLDAVTVEMFVLAYAKVFLTAGDSFWGSSTISRLVVHMRRGGKQTEIPPGDWRFLSHCDTSDVKRQWASREMLAQHHAVADMTEAKTEAGKDDGTYICRRTGERREGGKEGGEGGNRAVDGRRGGKTRCWRGGRRVLRGGCHDLGGVAFAGNSCVAGFLGGGGGRKSFAGGAGPLPSGCQWGSACLGAG